MLQNCNVSEYGNSTPTQGNQITVVLTFTCPTWQFATFRSGSEVEVLAILKIPNSINSTDRSTSAVVQARALLLRYRPYGVDG